MLERLSIGSEDRDRRQAPVPHTFDSESNEIISSGCLPKVQDKNGSNAAACQWVDCVRPQDTVLASGRINCARAARLAAAFGRRIPGLFHNLSAKCHRTVHAAIPMIAQHPRRNPNRSVATEQRVYTSCRIVAPGAAECCSETLVFKGFLLTCPAYEISNEAFKVENAVVCSIPRFGPKERHISHGPRKGALAVTVGNRCR